MRTKVKGRLPLLLLAFAVMVSIAALATGLAVKADAQTAAPDAQTAAPGAQTAAPDAQTAAPDAQTAAPDAQTAAPTIQSDLPDYPPGALVTLTGSNWQPGETVSIVVNDDQGQTWSRNVDVTADASGNITDQFNLPDWFVAVYRVTATGAQSGVVTTTFTDGDVVFKKGANAPPQFDVQYALHTGNAQNPSNTTCQRTGAPGSIEVRNNSGAGVAVGPNASIKLVGVANVPAGLQFVDWSTQQNGGGTHYSAGQCIAGPPTGNVDLYANFATAPTQQNTTLSVAPASGTYGGSASLSATLTAGGSGVGGKTVNFTVAGQNAGSATTNASGVATTSVNLGLVNAGTYNVSASFAGDANYNTSSGTNTLTVNKANQSITFGALANKAVNAPDFQVSATASSGLAVSFASSTPSTCTVNGNTVHIVGSGVCTITASQAGNNNYNAAAPVSQSFSIGKANQTINFVAPTGKTFGDADFNPGATASSGLAVSYSSSTPGVCTINSQTNNVHIVSAGTCTVTASQAGNANYNPAESVTRSFTIGKAIQTINFATGTPTTKNVDDPDFQVSATATSNLPVTFAASPSSTCTVTGNTVSVMGAGTCTITASQAGNDNYQAANASHTIAVSKTEQRTLTVTSPTSGNYGERLQMSASGGSGTGAVSFTATGTACQIPTSGTDAGKLVITSGTGTCSVTATKAGDGNYQSATSAPQSVAISKAELKIDADNQTVVYGAANPTLTYKFSGFVNGDTSAAGLTGNADCSIANGSDSDVGAYTGAISCAPGTLSSTNYRFATGAKGDVTITRRPIEVTADDKNKTYGENDPALTYSVTGGSLVQGDSLSGSLTREAGQGTGTYAIRQGTLSAGDNYTLTFKDGTLTINRAALTVTAEDKSKVYGGANPNFTVFYDGLTNGDTAADLSGQLQFSTQADQSSPVGTYDITPEGLTSSNYDISFAKGALTVTKADLTVTADDKAKTYGDENPPFTVSYEGFVNGDDRDDLGGALEFATDADAGSPVGSYDVTPSGLTSDNYTISFAKGTLTVTKADLTVTANDDAKTYGDPNPSFTAKYSGFVNGDDAASLDGTLGFDTQANQSSPVGTYDVTPKGLTSDNYAITFAKGTLTVDKADLTVTADDKTKVYGADNPALTGTLTGVKNNDGIAASYATEATQGSNVGTYAIVPSLNDPNDKLANYNVTKTNGTLTINKADLTVTADNKEKVYGADNPTFTVSYDGFVNGDGPASLGGTLAFDTQANQGSPVGAYDVTPKGLTSDNYSISFDKGTLTVTRADLTVTAENKTKVYGDANPAFTVSYSGFVNGDDEDDLGGELRFSTNAEAGSPVGSYEVTPSGLTSNNYTINFVKGALTVTKADLTVTTKDATKTYGDPNPAFDVGYSGFVNGDDKDDLDGTLAFDTAADASSPVGTYEVTPSGLTSDNYAITFAKGTLTVDKADLTVTADDKTKTYGADNPTFTASYSGFKNGDDKDDLGGTLAFDTSATASSPVGSYEVTPKGLTSNNYNISFVKGMLTVNKADLTVTADNKTKVYGEANPDFSVSYDGFVNDDDKDDFSGQLQFSTNANASSPVGSYDIEPSGLSSDNYSITFKSGTLSVTKADLTVTAKDAAKTYGDPNPAFDVTYNGFVNDDGPASLGGTLGYDTAATAASSVGTYDVTPEGLTSDNYTINFVKGTLTINKADLAVTADNEEKVYGADNPALTGNLTGVTNGDNITASYSTEATQSSNVGTYDIVPSLNDPDKKLSNYNVTKTNGTLKVNPAALTVTAEDKSKTYGDPNPNFTVRYSGFVLGQDESVLGGTLGFDTPATASSGVGTYAITPKGLTSNNYTIKFVDGTLKVTPATLTVTAENQQKVYGEANPPFTVTYDGFVNGDDKDDLGGTLVYDTAATAASPVGSYDITPSGLTSDNYNISFVKGTLKVNPAALTVTADNKSKTYGDPNPAFDATYTGFRNGDDEDDLGGELRFSTSADASSPVGTYEVTPSGLTSDNYTISFAKGTLTVTKRAIEVTAEDKTKTYGEDDPALTYEVTSGNLANGDAFDGSLTRDAGQDVGTYAIEQGTLSLSGNYVLSFKSATLTINKAPLTVTADNKEKVYGADNPTFTVTYDGFVNGDDKDDLGGTLAFDTSATASSGAGSYDVTPKGLTSGNYTISFVKGTLTVTKAPLTVTADNKTKIYGDANPAFTVSYAGFVNGDDKNDLSGTLGFDTSATATSPVGGYDVTPKGLTSDNYAIEFAKGTLTVTKADLTVTTKDAARVYGDVNPTFTASYSGFKLGDTPASLGGTLAFNTTANAGSPVGTYEVTPGGLTSSNYDITFVKGTLTVNKAPLTVTANNATKILGAANPTFTASYSGWKNGDTASVLSGSPALSTSATQQSPVGTYAITAAQGALSANNYSFNFKEGTLTIEYGWKGFLQPINDTAHQTGVSQSKFKLGQTIPVKFTIYDAAGTSVQQAQNPTFSRSNNLGSCDATTTLETATTITADANATYSFTGGQYHYNWSTKGLTAGEYRIYANLADGTRRYVDICLTK